MLHPSIVETMQTLAQLREATINCKAAESTHFSYNVYFCWDQEGADIDIAVQSEPGQLFSADVTVKGMPEWFTLSIGLGSGTFGKDDILGLALEASSSVPHRLAPFIRSADGDNRHDTHIADSAKIGPGAGNHALLMHSVDVHDPLAWAGSFHTLIVPLPREDFKLELRDMRLFHAPAQNGLRLSPRDLASLAF